MNATDIVAVARSWLGTPYHHQATLKGVGCDCLGLVRGVYADLCGHAPEEPPPYSPDWAEARGCETLIEAARRHLIEISSSYVQCKRDHRTCSNSLFWPHSHERKSLATSSKNALAEACAGDVLIFRMRANAVAKHCGILTVPSPPGTHCQGSFIHAIEGATVSEVPLSSWWCRRIAAVFRFMLTSDHSSGE
jgi:cell wall-associated NlpC family hydrolase